MPSGGGGSSTTRTITENKNEPWAGQKPFLSDIYRRAQGRADVPQQYYPGSTVAPEDPFTTRAYELMGARAGEGSENVDAAQRLNLATLRGDFLGGNPYLDEMYGRAARGVTDQFRGSVLPGLESRFRGAGRTRSGAYEYARRAATEELGSSLGDLATRFYGGAYETERGRQETAIGRAPGLAREDYHDIDRMRMAGQGRQQQAQQVLNDLINRFNFAQQEPDRRLNQYAGLVGGAIPGDSTSTVDQRQRGGGDDGFDWGQAALTAATIALFML
jgi:hypothetical protein